MLTALLVPERLETDDREIDRRIELAFRRIRGHRRERSNELFLSK